MKNLPDKIYLATTEEIQNLDNTFVGIAHSNPEDIIEPVEYIRKDAFIKKACEYWYQYNRDIVVLGCNEFTVNVEDFKKYMEE